MSATDDTPRGPVRSLAGRIRAGTSGAPPTVVGLVALVIVLQLERSSFLSTGNLVTLFIQAALYTMFGAAAFFALVLAELDLSLGYLAGVCAFTIAELMASPVNFPWWLATIYGLLVGAGVGGLQGVLVTRLGLPSAAVTLGGLLGLQGVVLKLASVDSSVVGGVISIPTDSPLAKLTDSQMSATVSWVVLIVALALYAAVTLRGVRRRRRTGLAAPAPGVALLSIGLVAVAGLVLVLVCNTNRGVLTPIRGVPWAIPFVLIIVALDTMLMGHTRLGRSLYAVGHDPDAARRDGINVAVVRTIGFALGGLTAGLAGLIYLSSLGNVSVEFHGVREALFALAAALIGGASLLGGRGRPTRLLLGGLVIAVVDNGLQVLGVGAAVKDVATAAVLIVALILDALTRRARRRVESPPPPAPDAPTTTAG